MKFVETQLKGAFVIDPDRVHDERGFFSRVFCEKTLLEQGLEYRFPQCGVSFNRNRGTLRGLHYQMPPHAETKIVRCTAGVIYDVIVDIRVKSTTYKHWVGVELSAANHRMIYVPSGFAHGFQTLEDNCEVFYQISTQYNADSARGVHYQDPDLAIKWPLSVTVISKRDRALPVLGDI